MPSSKQTLCVFVVPQTKCPNSPSLEPTQKPPRQQQVLVKNCPEKQWKSGGGGGGLPGPQKRRACGWNKLASDHVGVSRCWLSIGSCHLQRGPPKLQQTAVACRTGCRQKWQEGQICLPRANKSLEGRHTHTSCSTTHIAKFRVLHTSHGCDLGTQKSLNRFMTLQFKCTVHLPDVQEEGRRRNPPRRSSSGLRNLASIAGNNRCLSVSCK